MNAQRRQLFADGLVAGIVGYAVVVLFFGGWNLVEGRSPFYTAGLLGAAVFDGLRDASALTLAPGPVIAFNGLHMVAFLAFGFFAAWLVYETELHPAYWYLSFFLFLAAALLSYAAVLAVSTVLGELISPWLVVGSSVLGVAGVAGYLIGVHRSLIRRLRAPAEPPGAIV